MCDSGVMLLGEIRCWSLLGFKGLTKEKQTEANKQDLYVYILQHSNWHRQVFGNQFTAIRLCQHPVFNFYPQQPNERLQYKNVIVQLFITIS